MNGRTIPLSPQLLNTGTLSHFSLLNKVDIDNTTLERNAKPESSLEKMQQNTGPTLISSSTTSHDATVELNQTSSPSSSSSPSVSESTTPDYGRIILNNQNDLIFSISDVTDL